MEQLRRRQLLGGLAAVGAVGLAGCAVGSGGDDPEPLVVTNDPTELLGGPIEDARGDRVDVSPLVHNPGSAGEVEVTVTAFDDERGELDSTSEVFEFAEGEQRDVTIEFRIPLSTTFLSAEARRPDE